MASRWVAPTIRERRWLLSLFDLLVPGGAHPAFSLGARDAPMNAFVDDLARHAPARVILGLRACLWLLWALPPLYGGRFRSFYRLTRAEQLALLTRLGQSDVYLLRELPMLFKTMACLGLCGLPQVHAQLSLAPRDAEPPDWARDAEFETAPAEGDGGAA